MTTTEPLTSRIKSRLLAPIRRGREVAWAPDWMRLGNQLMLGLWAYEGRQAGRSRFVLHHPREGELVGLFPVFAEEYLVRADEVRFTDQRFMPWSGTNDHPPLDWRMLDRFVADVLLPRSPLTSSADDLADTVVVNVRRGDYYSVPQYRAEFGMNIEAYVATAVARAIEDDGMPGSFLVVSDDIAWCREHLAAQLGAIAPVRFRPQGDPVGDLAALIHASRLVIPNSTFSMWGGYIGDVIHPGRAVYAPWLFSRSVNGGGGREYRPKWSVIADIPGGWDVISE